MNSAPDPQQVSSASTTALHKKAEDNLQYIRASMESATSFTAVSGKGYVVAGFSASIAAWLAAQQTSPSLWLAVWMVELLIAACLMLFMSAQKATGQGGSLWSTNGKKLLFAFFPAMAVGGVLTLSFFLSGDISLLPGIWLSLYGASMMTAGAYSVAVIPVMGALFLILGSIVLLTNMPTDLALGLGMGGLHIVLGVLVWRDYGG
jgi:hypothetical protein